MKRKLALAALSGAGIAALVFVAVLYAADLEITERQPQATTTENESAAESASESAVAVPSLVGMELGEASRRAADAGLTVKVKSASWFGGTDTPPGFVDSQSEKPGSLASPGDTVVLWVVGEG